MYLSKLAVQGMRAGAEGELVVELPGRFAVLSGANSSGKTTFSDAAYLVHPETFPSLPRLSAASLGSGLKRIDVEYRLEDAGRAEGPLGEQVLAFSGSLAAGQVVAAWGHTLTRSMGTIRSHWDVRHDLAERMRLIYLPAHRNPLDELRNPLLVGRIKPQAQCAECNRSGNSYGAMPFGYCALRVLALSRSPCTRDTAVWVPSACFMTCSLPS